MEINQRPGIALLPASLPRPRVQHTKRDCPVRAADRCELDLTNGINFALRDLMQREYLHVLPSFDAKAFLTAKLEGRVVREEIGYCAVYHVGAGSDIRDFGGVLGHCDRYEGGLQQ